MLPVSVPSHCELMHDAARRFAVQLEAVPFSAPRFPVVHNVDAAARTETAAIKQALIDQMHRPVHWTACIRAMRAAGISRIIECGPGRVLSGLIKRIDSAIDCTPIHDPQSLQAALDGVTA